MRGGYSKGPKFRDKVRTVLHEGKAGRLHSGSKQGPMVQHGSQQELAIALSEGRRAVGKKRRRK